MTAVAITPEQREEFVVEAEARVAKLETEVHTLRDASKDAKADTRALTLVTLPHNNLPLRDRIAIEVPQQPGLRILLSEQAHRQIAARVKIPWDYYDRMWQGQLDLLAENVNRWFKAEPEARLLRMRGPLTEQEHVIHATAQAPYRLRAFLGASFRTLDNADFLAAAIPAARERGAYLHSYDLNDQRMHARFLTFAQDARDIVARVATERGVTEAEAQQNPAIKWVNEVLSVGVALRNSETGFAALDVTGFMEILRCLNLLTATSEFNRRHVGRRRNGNDGFAFEDAWSEQTRRLDNAAIFSQIGDTILAVLSEAKQAELAGKVLGAKTEPLALPVPTFEFVGNLGANLNLTEAEVRVLQEETERAVIQEGVVTRFALSQGITALARRTDTADFDRKVELERYGFEMLDRDVEKLLAAGRTPATRN